MTSQALVALLFSTKGITPARIQKAQGNALRHKLDWADVLAAMTDEQRALVSQ